jgi:hypothetical protein
MVALRTVRSLQTLVYIGQCSFRECFSSPGLWTDGSFNEDECIQISSLIHYKFSRLMFLKKPQRQHTAALASEGLQEQ